MKRPVLWVTGSLTAATVLAASLLIVTATRGNVRPALLEPTNLGTRTQSQSDCGPAHCDAVRCGPACSNTD